MRLVYDGVMPQNSQTTHSVPSVSVERSPDQNITLTAWVDFDHPIRIQMDLPGALDLLRDLANVTTSAATSAVTNIKRGDCPTCRNRRLVDVQRGTRTTNDHCPDCNTEDARDPWARPRLGGGIA